jgi:retron-type reverse transcriptase
VWVRLNDENSEFFLTRRGVGQGDPASPILFNFMPHVFTRILIRATANNQISGLMQGLNNTGVVSMQYADDTLLFFKK